MANYPKKLSKIFYSGVVGIIFSLSVHAAIPTDASGRPIAGETPQALQTYKVDCPDCVKVASDIAMIRQQFCNQSVSIDQTIIKDPLYPYLNGIRLVLLSKGGYTSMLYSSARKVIEANVNCDDVVDWLERSQKVLENSFNISG